MLGAEEEVRDPTALSYLPEASRSSRRGRRDRRGRRSPPRPACVQTLPDSPFAVAHLERVPEALELARLAPVAV